MTRLRLALAVCAPSLAAAAVLTVGLRTGAADAARHAPAVSRASAGSGMHADRCAGTCFSLYSRQLGFGLTMNAHIPGDKGIGGTAGRKINLHLAKNARPNENFVPSAIGLVWQFCGTGGSVSFAADSYACQHYQNLWIFEAQWSPSGNESGLCAGVSRGGRASESVTLQPCGVSARTLWIGDRLNGLGGDCRYAGNYCPWVNGAGVDTNLPLALTLDPKSLVPANALKVEPLALANGVAGNDQEFAYFWGPVA
jgi:hypothetical protein